MRSAGGPAGREFRLTPRLTLVVGLWCAAILVPFLWQFPVPVRPAPLWEAIASLGAAIALLITASIAGRSLLRVSNLLSLLEGPGERLLFSAALGYGGLGLGTFLAGLAGVLFPIPCILFAAAAWILGRVDLREGGRDLRHWWVGRPRPGGLTLRVFRAALLLAMALMLLEALAPPTAYDALRYHLRLPELYAEAGRWFPMAYDFNGYFPQNVDMLFTLGFVFGTPGAAGLTHLFMGWLAAAASGLLATRLAGPAAGWAAAAIFYTMPVVAINSAWAYVDLGLALFLLLAVRALQGWWEDGRSTWAVLAGGLAGLALGTKYTGAAIVVVGCGVILARGMGRRRLAPRRVGIALCSFLVVGMAVASPWLARNTWLQGNPVYPFAVSIFGTPESDTYRAERHQAVLERPEVPRGDAVDLLLLPWRFTMQPWVRDEMIGPSLLVLLPLILGTLCGRTGWVLAVAGSFGVLWVFLSPQMRLFVHGLGLLSALGGVAWARLQARGGAVPKILSVALGIAMLASLANLAVLQRGLSDPFPVVVGMESRETYLARMLDGHRAMQFINRDLPPDARVLFIGEIYGYYCERDHVLGSKFDRAPIVDWISETADLNGFLDRLRAERVTHVLYSQVQLRKFADLPGRYLDWPDERARGVYREFMTRWIEVLYDDPDAIVARVRDRPVPPTDPPGEAP